MKLVYICSPYAGEIERNVRFAQDACRYAISQCCAPMAVHLLYPQLLNDAVPAEREAGIQMGLRVLAACEELWISTGMSYEIAEAERLGIPIRRISAEQIQGGHTMEKYGIWARRSAASVCGASEAWVKQDVEPLTFDTYEEAASEARRLIENTRTPNVAYFAKGMDITLEEAPFSGMKLQY
ncbi:DUF7768 domain-containing protein [Lacrimispora brassicae]|nr:hypothetical protein CLFS41_47310 [Clostridium sp. FS41]